MMVMMMVVVVVGVRWGMMMVIDGDDGDDG